jgi:hypothetical protein
VAELTRQSSAVPEPALRRQVHDALARVKASTRSAQACKPSGLKLEHKLAIRHDKIGNF